jgi:hypothetical protein
MPDAEEPRMATLALTGPGELLGRLPSQSLPVSVVASTAEENDDAAEDQVPALEALGYSVRVVTADAELLARWQEIEVDEPGVS